CATSPGYEEDFGYYSTFFDYW
nr:immunoglobulin heavy chain junction region [Macaca mulatta]MOV49658.1 immunoglobulin heavy chain junction region [Macaca mulatta]MOV51422.1 immunoglobulin heavy chain junction region [Macaca mulatta]MOV53042.1 immunoglobulin heavy chain junction region [Macaca mulatta]